MYCMLINATFQVHIYSNKCLGGLGGGGVAICYLQGMV